MKILRETLIGYSYLDTRAPLVPKIEQPSSNHGDNGKDDRKGKENCKGERLDLYA